MWPAEPPRRWGTSSLAGKASSGPSQSLDHLLAIGELSAARARADALLASNPKDLSSHLAKAKLSAFDRDLEEAHRWVDKAQVLGAPKVELELIRANLAGQEGDLVRAESLYQAALLSDPHRAEAHFGLGMARIKDGDTAGGLAALSRAVELAPENPAFHYRYGQALLLAGKRVEGKEQLQAALRLEKKFLPAHLALYQAFMRERNLRMARLIVERGLTVLPDNPRLLAALTNAKLLTGDLPGASKTAIALAGQRPKDPEAQGNLALILMLQAKREEAISICRTQESLGATNATLKMVEAMYWEGEDPPRLDEAVAAYEAAMGLDPEDWRAANNLGQLLMRISEGQADPRHLERALTVLEEAVRRVPQQLEPRLNLALVLAQRGDSEQALSVLQPVLDAKLPENSPLREQAHRLARTLNAPKN